MSSRSGGQGAVVDSECKHGLVVGTCSICKPRATQTPSQIKHRRSRLESTARGDSSSTVDAMRRRAIAGIKAALLRLERPAALRPSKGKGRYQTPGGQVIYVRTRSDPNDTWFTVQEECLDDAHWFVFVADSVGSVVVPADVLRDLAPGLPRARRTSGDYKPRFLVLPGSCEVYVNGDWLTATEWLDNYTPIAEFEPPKA